MAHYLRNLRARFGLPLGFVLVLNRLLEMGGPRAVLAACVAGMAGAALWTYDNYKEVPGVEEVGTFRTEITMYTTPSATNRVAAPPVTVKNLPSRNWIFCSGSCNRELISRGRSVASRERSAI